MEHQEGLTWQALQWADGTRYEGLTKNGKLLHSHGVLTFPNKDRYEGQFEDGVMHGVGAYVWGNGMVYRGEWSHGRMHGCGTAIWKQQQDGDLSAAEGKFFGSDFVGDVMPCSKTDGYESAVEADMAAYQARSFLQWRGLPNGTMREQRQQPPLQQQLRPPPQQQQQQQAGPGRQSSGPPAAAAGGGRAGGGAAAVGDGAMLDEQQRQKLEDLVQRLALQPRKSAA